MTDVSPHLLVSSVNAASAVLPAFPLSRTHFPPYTPTIPFPQHFVPAVTAIFVLDNDGQRLSAKYFSPQFANNADKVSLEMGE